MHKVAVICAVLWVLLAAGQDRGGPDTILVNGRVFTGEPATPWAEAIGIRHDRIVAVGTNAEVRALAPAGASVLDARGRLVVPGLNDAHTHPGTYPDGVRIEAPPAFEEDPPLATMIARVRTAAARAPKGGWIFGEIGAAVLDDPGATRMALDEAAPGHKVLLASWHGHGCIVNTAALRDLGIALDAPDPAGGFYVRMPDGRTLTGEAHEYADYRIRQRVSMQASVAAQQKAFRAFMREAATYGFTSVQMMMTAMPATAGVAAIGTEPQVRARIIEFPMIDIGSWTPPAGPPSPPGAAGPLVTVSGTKFIVDGTPVERLALMREPFADAPGRGRLNFERQSIEIFLRRASAAGVQPMFHTVGDAALDVVLDALEATGGEKWRALRPRIEHGDMLDTSHYPRMVRLGGVLVQNPSHFMIPGMITARLGPQRALRSASVKSSLSAGVPLAFGSDGPLNPYLNIMFATMHPGNPSEALTREQALTAYTQGSAFAEMQESDKGRIAPGMLADIAVLSQDIFTVPSQALPATTSVLTMVGGRITHEVK